MSWASLLKKDKQKEKPIKINLPKTINYKKLNGIPKNKIKENKIEIKNKVNISKESKIDNKNNLRVLDVNLESDFTDKLFNNYQRHIFKESNNLDYLNSCDTFHFFMNYSKPIIYNNSENDEGYYSESEYYSE